jgi:uroporphyrinogen-III synthase
MALRVWATRDEPAGGPLCQALEAAELTAVHEPVLARSVVSDARAEIERLGPEDWLVLTSPYAVRTIDLEAARRSGAKIAVVGPSTGAEVEGRGLIVDLMGPGEGSGLFEMLAVWAQGRTLCYPRSSLVEPPELPDDIVVISPIIYENAPRDYDRSVIGRVDVVAVASASAVRVIGRIDKPYASIGPATSKAIRELELEPWTQAAEPSFEALARAIVDQSARDSGSQRA